MCAIVRDRESACTRIFRHLYTDIRNRASFTITRALTCAGKRRIRRITRRCNRVHQFAPLGPSLPASMIKRSVAVRQRNISISDTRTFLFFILTVSKISTAVRPLTVQDKGLSITAMRRALMAQLQIVGSSEQRDGVLGVGPATATITPAKFFISFCTARRRRGSRNDRENQYSRDKV